MSQCFHQDSLSNKRLRRKTVQLVWTYSTRACGTTNRWNSIAPSVVELISQYVSAHTFMRLAHSSLVRCKDPTACISTRVETLLIDFAIHSRFRRRSRTHHHQVLQC
jgi:aromatic ring hydroxylase